MQVLFCCVKLLTGETTCIESMTRFARVRCVDNLGVGQMDLYNISINSPEVCEVDCARDPHCKSFVYDSRQRTCSHYREKVSHSSSYHDQKYFLIYETRDRCGPSPDEECYRITQGKKTYSGRKVTTESGLTCQHWATNDPHYNLYTNPDLYPDTSMAAAENFCRVLDDSTNPWCYTMDRNVRWDYCAVPLCLN
ncbi:plasminogen-like [Gigantopelta aegis]|uniref:plasminogen-like n=1 Tax=Gigantopelta aegis TaxID=1735272 RepID=UPI001B88961D|nr:plasminogen-like [Gigantopelta aegis]